MLRNFLIILVSMLILLIRIPGELFASSTFIILRMRRCILRWTRLNDYKFGVCKSHRQLGLKNEVTKAIFQSSNILVRNISSWNVVPTTLPEA